jgi:glycosyltransferase involved in cell wall biosynthesis
MQPLISCIIPTFNRERLIGTAIQSFLNQDYENRELVIWDNGFDGTQYLVPRDHRIRYFQSSIEKLRIGNIRNRASALTMGSVIAHFDSDDWSAPGRLTYQMKMMQKSEKAVVGFHSLLFWDGAAGEQVPRE